MKKQELEIALLLQDIYMPDEITVWFTKSHPLLGDRSAKQMIADGEFEQVKTVAQNLVDCVYI